MSGEKKRQPIAGYRGPVYDHITQLHDGYLRALAHVSRDRPVTEEEWLRACGLLGIRTHNGAYPQRISTFMLYGVFVYHGLVEIDKGRPYMYKITDEGLERTEI